MGSKKSKIIYTIGHSTHSEKAFFEMLHSFEIKNLVDIRRLPGSRKFPQFDQDRLQEATAIHEIKYIYLADLGGRRKALKDSINTVWKNASFRGYADYMDTAQFKNAVSSLEKIVLDDTTAIMCAEAVWWRCHRSMVSDFLKAKGWQVQHIMGVGKSQEHPYTSPARIVDGAVLYSEE